MKFHAEVTSVNHFAEYTVVHIGNLAGWSGYFPGGKSDPTDQIPKAKIRLEYVEDPGYKPGDNVSIEIKPYKGDLV